MIKQAAATATLLATLTAGLTATAATAHAAAVYHYRSDIHTYALEP